MRTILAKTAIILTMSMTFALTSVEAAAKQNVGNLAGTWDLQGQPEPTCGVQPFRNFTSISREGKIVNADPEVGTGLGEAYRIGHNQYAAGFFGLINDNGTILSYEIQGTLTLLDASHFVGVFRATVFDPIGNPACVYEGTVAAYRLVPMPY